MNKTFIVLLLMIANATITFADICSSNRIDLNGSCILLEECGKVFGRYISINGSERKCIEKCPITQYVLIQDPLMTCTTCPDTNPVPNSDQTDCGLCTGDQIADITTHTCLEDSTKCTGFIQTDGNRCGPDCGYDYQPLDGKKCLNYCPLSDMRIPTNVTCLTTYSGCTNGVINEAGDLCLDKCPDGSAPVQKDNYKQCKTCSGETPYYQIIDQVQKCVFNCEGGLIQDNSNFTCIKTSSCQKYLSSDLKQCNSSCGSQDFVNGSTTENTYIACTKTCDKYTYSLNDINYCVSTCLSNQIPDKVSHKCVSSKAECSYALSYDGTYCTDKCDFSKKEAVTERQCQPCTDYWMLSDNTCRQDCPDGTIKDKDKMLCYSTKKECKTNISSDGTQCTTTCNSGLKETSVSQNNGEYSQCIACQQYYFPSTDTSVSKCLDKCPSGQITDATAKQCLSKLSDCLKYVSADKSSCTASCDNTKKEYPEITTVVTGGAYQLCQVCQKYLQVTEGKENKCQVKCDDGSLIDDVNKQCYGSASLCPTYVSADSTKCIASCDVTKKQTVKQENGFKQCVVCEQYYTPPSGASPSTCTESCAEGKIQDEVNKLCLSVPTECKAYVSSDSKKCQSTCDATQKEYPKAYAGYKKCVVCTDYYTANEDITKSTCTTSCDSTKTLAIIPTGICGAKSDGCGIKQYLSSDQTSCDKQCNFPDIQKSEACVTEDACIKGGSMTYETVSPILCVSKDTSCPFKSSDGNRCVKTCVSIKEAEPANGTKKCQACVSPNKFYLIVDGSSKTGGCKASVSSEDQKALLDTYLNSTPQSIKEVESIKSSISDLIETLVSTITASSDNSKAVKSIEDYAISLLKQIQTGDTFTSIKNTPQSVGSTAGVKTVFQAAKEGKKFKKSLSIKNMMSDSPADLTEDKTDDSVGYLGIISSIIKKNPGCNSANCQDYPAIKVQGVTSFSRLRLLPNDQTFSAEFPVTQASQNYVCLTYDLSTNQVLSNAPATMSSDGTTVTCALSSTGSTSIYLDTTCVYLDTSKCSSGSSDDGLSAGGIVGIVIGSIAFAGIVGVGCFFLYKNLLKKKRSSVMYEKPIQTENV